MKRASVARNAGKCREKREERENERAKCAERKEGELKRERDRTGEKGMLSIRVGTRVEAVSDRGET